MVVAPTSLDGGGTSTLVFTITNSDSEGNLLHWVKVARPSSDFTITSGDGPSVGIVTVDPDGSWVTIQTSLSAGESGDFSIGITTGNNAVSSSAFTIQASNTSEGDEPTSCAGDSSVSISANTQALLAISNIRVAAADTSATITWSTGGSTTGRIDYGTTTSYGSFDTDSTSSTSHSISLSSLSASTTYHFRITSIDSSQNSIQSSDNSFTTAAAGATVTVTTTVTTTTLVTPSPSPTPVPDTTPPKIEFLTDFLQNYESTPTIEGNTTDARGIAGVEYSVDEGKNWLPAETNFKTGDLIVNFAFRPIGLEDGNYQILVRSTDTSGNVQTSKPQVLVIDRLPPQIGAGIFSTGPQIIDSGEDGIVDTLVGVKIKLTFSAVGGPTEIKLVANDISFAATRNIENGFWSATLDFPTPGIYKINAHAIDGAGNNIQQELSVINVLPNGNIKSMNGRTINDSRISVYYFDNDLQRFNLWNGDGYGQENPQDAPQGKYSLMLPPGTYYIQINSSFYRTLKTNIFTIKNTSIVNSNFELEEKRAFVLGPITFPLPDFRQTFVSLELGKERQEYFDNSLLNKEFPYFKFNDFEGTNLRGKPTVITLLSIWHPQGSAQLSILNELIQKDTINSLIIFSQNTISSANIFVKRGGYDIKYVTDPDGVLVGPLKLTNIPTHFFIDRKGVIVKIKSGVLSRQELLDNLIN